MPPSQRVTRSTTARLTADADPSIDLQPSQTSPTNTTATGSPPVRPAPAPRKRKAANEPSPQTSRETRKTKRPRSGLPVSANEQTEKQPPQSIEAPTRGKRKAVAAVMSSTGFAFPTNADGQLIANPSRQSSDISADTSPQQVPRDAARRKSSRRKSKEGGNTSYQDTATSSKLTTDLTASATPTASRKTKRAAKKEQDALMKDVDEKVNATETNAEIDEEQSREDVGAGAETGDDQTRPFGQEDDLESLERNDDPFGAGYLARFAGHGGLSSSLRALSGIVSGTHSRLRNILEQLRTKEDPSIQLIALQELAELLLVSNEDNLAGHFAPDQYVKELVTLMQPNELTGEENPDVMLLACRCLANMMEALPASTASVVYGGAVPIVCQKLLEINYIDLAEQSLSTLEKISVEFPSSIVREGGLTACLTYLDFFATGTQRTAVTTAANCCRNIPEDSFPTVRDVMPILLTTLQSSDQRVVEQASLCVARIIDSFKYHENKLEELVSPALLKAIIRLLLPGSTNMIGPNIHTQFLRVLSISARASPRLSVELLKMNVVDTLYQILTGVSPPTGTDGIAAKIDKNVIMQSIIRTPREQIFETLNVICELLPTVSQESLMFVDELQDAGFSGSEPVSLSARAKSTANNKRIELLQECPEEVKRFAVIFFPTLMHAYTSTVNLSVRQKVLTAQLKMLSNLQTDILESALCGVTYTSHLAGILSQQENPSLVTFALQAAELLLKRLETSYRPQFYREGIFAEISALAERALQPDTTLTATDKVDQDGEQLILPGVDAPGNNNADHDGEPIDLDVHENGVGDGDDEDHDDENDENADNEETHADEDDDDHEDDDDDDQENDGEHSEPPSPGHSRHLMDVQDLVTLRAKRFVEAHAYDEHDQMRSDASQTMKNLKGLVQELRACYGPVGDQSGASLFTRLAKHFDGDALESITSYELMTSGIVEVLLEVFNMPDDHLAKKARSDFIRVFMATHNQAKLATGDANSPSTAFSVLVHKLQELLSRTEHFEVITVHHNAFDSNRGSAAAMLAKQLRLKLVADEDSGIPRPYRTIMVSIHAIAKLKALDDYLRPRINLAERPRGARREGITSAMAAYAAAMAGRGIPPPNIPSLSSSLPPVNSAKKASRSNHSKSDAAAPESHPGNPEESTPRLRRSSRRQTPQTSASVPPVPPAGASDRAASDIKDVLQAALECADEAQISEDEDDDMDADLDALVDDLEEGGLEQDVPEPSAVNIESAGSGKVTACTEDGARVNTPTQTASTPTRRDRLSASARLAAARELLATPTSSARPMSYASALQQTPQDWHIEFSVNGQPVTSETTIYRACHFNQGQGDEIVARNIWSATHTITFKRVQGPPPSANRDTGALNSVEESHVNGLPPSLDKHPITSNILRLMSIIHEVNLNLDDVVSEQQNANVKFNAENPSQFINTKLTAKLNRQLDEPLIVASQCLPSWSEDLARLYPFLFPFETRHLFLQSTSFGYSRLMTRWQGTQSENESRRRHDDRPFLGRPQRQKVRISRSRILESAIKVMELYGSSSSILEVEYFEEVGTGLGPTLEFYSTVSKEFSKKKTKLWREDESFENSEFAFGKRGLFPAPMSENTAHEENGKRILHLFKMLGKFVARSMLDSRIIDVSFNPTFFRIGDGSATVAPTLDGAVQAVDEVLARSLKTLQKFAKAKRLIDEDPSLTAAQKVQKADRIRVNDARIQDLSLDFTLPGYSNIELQPHGASIDVTLDNIDLYIDRVIDLTLGSGVQRQVDAFRAGFSQVFPYVAMRSFTPNELIRLFGRTEEDWSLETLMDSMKADHGYNLDSKSVQNLLQVMSEFSEPARRDFLQFVTGSPKLPIGGFKALTPMFTVVCKPSEPPYSSDDYLPSVMTCVNYLKMPDYSTLDILKDKLNMAIKEGQGAFHLS